MTVAQNTSGEWGWRLHCAVSISVKTFICILKITRQTLFIPAPSRQKQEGLGEFKSSQVYLPRAALLSGLHSKTLSQPKPNTKLQPNKQTRKVLTAKQNPSNLQLCLLSSAPKQSRRFKGFTFVCLTSFLF